MLKVKVILDRKLTLTFAIDNYRSSMLNSELLTPTYSDISTLSFTNLISLPLTVNPL